MARSWGYASYHSRSRKQMKEPTSVFSGIEMDGHLYEVLLHLPAQEMDEFLLRCKQLQYARLDGATTADERLAVQIRVNFVEDWRKFFKSLLTKPQK